MLYNSDIAKVVAEKIDEYKLNAVVDPVMVATSGDSLSNKTFVDVLKKELVSKAFVLTPNIDEAEVLTGNKIKKLDDVKDSCKKLFKMGSKNVFLKGGHLKGNDALDVFYDGKKFSVFTLPKVSVETHGSGCNLSSLIAGFLALGKTPLDAVGESKHVLWNMIKNSYKPGKGFNVLNVNKELIDGIPGVFESSVHFDVWNELNESSRELIDLLPESLIPEVGINIGYAVPDAKNFDDVVGLDGRIIKKNGRASRCGVFCFGGSKHVATIVLTVMCFDSSYRCAMNIKYSKDNLKRCEKAGFKIGYFDRKNEPKSVDSTMEWGTKKVLDELGFVPDMIYDEGAVCKEPMIRLLAKSPTHLVDKVKLIC
jgi:hydroxymethylpyrimidine kinase / phosphomethylpyrimidine kinase / thiamine-phosphate diphosphorylase